MVKNDNQITVTSPLLPDLDEFTEMLRQIWNNKWITNNGDFHQRLEKELANYLGVEYISLFTNGTIPLIVALQALGIKREVITTPYSFVATSHSIIWNDIKPVFVDVDPLTCNIDPSKIEAAITDQTSAILAVHCYGIPCNLEAIQKIANRHNLKVIYDAAHAFGVKTDNQPLCNFGDLSTLSFHATKVFNTIEGGAIISHSAEMKQKIDYLRNFGFAGETEVADIGINGKLDEIRSAYGLLNLQQIDNAIAWRKTLSERYRISLNNIEGIRFIDIDENITYNYSHFPIFIDAEKFGMTRDNLYFRLKEKGIFCRRYFYPLITEFTPYRDKYISPDTLIEAKKLSESVICLPIFHNLSLSAQDYIISEILFCSSNAIY